MIRKSFFGAAAFYFFLTGICSAQPNAPKPFGPIPTENQVRWQEMEYYAFLHFSINTFTDQEWGSGGDDAKLFNPDSLDCRQWARVCKEAGMKGIILTAKHHSGFCLWPSKYTEYSVKNAPWKNGKGDIVRELSNACKEYGLKLGIYLSPWDRNYADYGNPRYITYFRNQLRELLTQYGDIFEIWFDGANGGSGYYGGANETRTIDRTTYYDWKNTYQLIRSLQPKIVIWNDGGERGDLRWVGTEAGNVGETNWSLLNDTGDVPWNMLHYGLENGNAWVPGEVNTSIRPGWFYHQYEDTKVKTLPHLLDIYYSSFGRNGTLLLNFPIDRHGLIHANDEKAAVQLADAVKEAFAVNLAEKAKVSASNIRGKAKAFVGDRATDGKKDTYWATDDGVTAASMTLDFGKPVTFNCFMAQEYIRLGQRVRAFTVSAMVDGSWKELARATTIGYRRILRFPAVSAAQLKFTITDAKACPVIANIGVFNVPPVLTAPAIIRNKEGKITIASADSQSVVYYTLNGNVPTSQSTKYTGPVTTDGKVEVQAVAVDPSTGRSSPVSQEQFDMPHTSWKIVGTDDIKAAAVIDGDPHSAWHQPKGKNMPADLIIDMGEKVNLTGFRYLPDQGRHAGIITHYQLLVSQDGQEWKKADEGEFSNINNNPLWQVKKFPPVNARYINLRAIHNTEGNDDAGYAEIDVITAPMQ
ncbi:alpha-L-fucosidase [Flavitalea sp. BT771]|uniref:alpha-L-fucosidase n=1 Tax=Flavitalea sp. BT771 TaxID=3063329 RepID=UPI0026E2AD78|nr:alpha-L-fucosidase [Flavitalea sp. BT771]MDO6430295.1 alpha-L-fucosidase [Flavitalea sp. BT771]MDV6219565.1 alpha-L-fucosidase [Flavitalea sp. BT771]